MHKYLGYVNWFDKSSGQGMVYCPSIKSSLYVHYSAILFEDNCHYLFRNLEKDSPVEFTIYENSYMKQIDKIWPLKFNYSVENEHKLTRLMDDLFFQGDTFIFKLADNYYKESGSY